MLAFRLAQHGFDNIPPVTLGLVALNALIFFNPEIVPGLDFGYVEDACVQGAAVLHGMQIHRLWLSALYHLSDMHLCVGHSLCRPFHSRHPLKPIITTAPVAMATSLLHCRGHAETLLVLIGHTNT
jgi:hypothetical protein